MEHTNKKAKFNPSPFSCKSIYTFQLSHFQLHYPSFYFYFLSQCPLPIRLLLPSIVSLIIFLLLLLPAALFLREGPPCEVQPGLDLTLAGFGFPAAASRARIIGGMSLETLLIRSGEEQVPSLPSR